MRGDLAQDRKELLILAYDFGSLQIQATARDGDEVSAAKSRDLSRVTNAPLIAVIDDDAGMRESLDGLVRSLGYRVASYCSAEAFLGADEAHVAQCVITDLQMPGGMDGIALAGSVSPMLYGRVILISAFSNEAVRAKAECAGVRCFLNKPFDGDTLIDCIESTLAA